MTAPDIAAQLGSLICDGVTPDDDGLVWTVTDIQGWYDTTSLRSATQEREPYGETITVARQNARPIVLTLDCTMANPDTRPKRLGTFSFPAIETIKSAARCVDVATLLIVTDPLRATQALVRRTGPLHTAFLGPLVVLQAQISLTAPDPRRYSPTRDDDSFSMTGSGNEADQTIVVGGTVDTPLIAELQGPAVNPRLSNHALGPDSAHRPFFQWIGTLTDATQHLIVNTGTGTVLKDNVPVPLAPGSQLFDLVPGNNPLTYERDFGTGTATATISRHNAYD